MNSAIDVKQLESLEDLKRSLLCFREMVTQSLNRIDNMHRKIISQMEQKMRSEQKQLERLLRLERHKSTFANAQINTILQQLDLTQRYLAKVRKQILDYKKIKGKIIKHIAFDMVNAQFFLNDKIIEIAEYYRVSMEIEKKQQFASNHKNSPTDIFV